MILRTAAALSLLMISVATPVQAQEDTSRQWSESELHQVIQDYLMNNPTVLLDSVDGYAKSQAREAEERANEMVRENGDMLFNNPALPVAGNPDGDVTIVEFLDYNCGYCKKAMESVMTLIGEDEDLRVVLVDIPILGPASNAAAQWALAAQKQDRYMDYHIALMEHSGRLDEPQLLMIADRIGLDTEKLRADKDSPEVQAQIQANMELARTLGVRGTPAFVVGERLVRGYVGLDALRQGIAETRAGDEG